MGFLMLTQDTVATRKLKFHLQVCGTAIGDERSLTCHHCWNSKRFGEPDRLSSARDDQRILGSNSLLREVTDFVGMSQKMSLADIQTRRVTHKNP